MKRYTIDIEYVTGNSFGSQDAEDSLGISWDNLDMAKDALRRIRAFDEHATEWDRKRGASYEERQESFRQLPGYSEEFPEVCIMFVLDDGTEHRHSRFWEGYFETLKGTIIVDSKGDDMVYRPK